MVAELSGFRWSGANLKIGSIYVALIGAIFLGWYWVPRWIVQPLGALFTVGAAIFSLREISTLVPAERMPGPLRPIARIFRGSDRK
jgi:PST family polysaccharide transporter